MKIKILGFLLVLLAGVATLIHLQKAQAPVQATIDLQEALSDQGGNFAEVTPGRSFSFPTDHGPHPAYKTEWWYFTGNLQNTEGRRFGYQVTLFRIGLPQGDSQNPSSWATRSLMMGHLALSDVENQQFFSFERFSRAALGLAGAEEKAEKIWLENWVLRYEDGWTLSAEANEENGPMIALNLRLEELKKPVLQGEGGYSRKGPESRHASYYVSQTRLDTSGIVSLDEETFQVSGLSWFDHEWSSEAMAEGLEGWDWFSLQLDDGTELMLYLLRYENGTLEPASSGTYVSAGGEARHLEVSQFTVTKTDQYKSAQGVTYPSRWNVSVPSLDLDLEVSPVLQDQEMTSGVPYWEGAVDVKGRKQDTPVSGQGFVELTGYK